MTLFVALICSMASGPQVSDPYGGYFLSLFVNTWLLNWCFEPSQPLVITSGLKETFIKRYILKRTNKAEKRPEEPSEKTESCRQNLWNEIQLKGP